MDKNIWGQRTKEKFLYSLRTTNLLAHITQKCHEKEMDVSKSVTYHNNRTVFPICKQKLYIIKNTTPWRKKKGGGGESKIIDTNTRSQQKGNYYNLESFWEPEAPGIDFSKTNPFPFRALVRRDGCMHAKEPV